MTMKSEIILNDNQIALLNQLEKLFEYAPAESISKSLHEVFFSYLQNNTDTFPDNFETIAGDFQFLMQFIREAEKISGDKKI
ncbi:MAG: hypothetical protein JWO09_3506 [Bacteroidetes bacterium]|nr:hypothetical protein [Bacteroidota bacterium]